MPHPSSDELLIARLFDLPAADRPAFWQRACADDPSLRNRHPEFSRLFLAREPNGTAPSEIAMPAVIPDAMAGVRTSTLNAAGHDALGARLGPMAGILASALGAADHEAPGVRIGHYKLLQKIGEGGFGAVWMAEQVEPIRRRVALKIVKVGMDTEEVIARFEVERQALALMDHPNIARVFDAGATAAGRPFFVMELVRGVAITRYCDDNRLDAASRLRLFISVCQAVQHAHQKGIIHRDLKPSNILVTVHDGTPVPKVIDFGIAKATDKQLTEKTLVTQFHAFVGTPAYTSPEQMEMSGLDVDTRSDIYSLGVLLYELLTGNQPFDSDALIKSGLEAMRRTIREVDPPRPSHRLGTLAEADRTSVAHARSTDAAKLSLLLRGDVDWIVMHCLEKDRTRRYETANALARDVQRHLAHEPVSARPPSQYYRIRKFVRRHKFGVAATAAIAVSLVGGLIATSTLFVREHTARNRAVAAEASESQLRQQADAARAAEAHRASRTSLALAEQRLQEDGRGAEGLAHLVRAARSDAANLEIGPRLLSALAHRSFPVPIGEPLRHPTPLWRTLYTSDGRHGLTVGQDFAIRYWDLDRGTLLHTFKPDESFLANHTLVAVDLSPDGASVAVGDVNGHVYVWSLKTGLRSAVLPRHPVLIGFLQFSPDGRALAVAYADGTVRISELETGKPPLVLEHSMNRIRLVRFSPDGTRVVTTTYRGPWRIWQLPGGEPVTPDLWTDNIPGATRAAIGVDFNPAGTLVAISDNAGAQLFDSTNGEKVGEHMTHSGPCYGGTFTSDGKKFVTGSDDGTARVWEVPTGKPLLPAWPHQARVYPPFVTPGDHQIVTRSDDGMVRVWSLVTGRLAMEPIRMTHGPNADLSPDGGEILAARSDGMVQRWRVVKGAAATLTLPHAPSRLGIAPTADPAPIAWAIYPDRMQKMDLLTGRALGPPRMFPHQISARYLLPANGQHFVVNLADGDEYEFWDLRGSEIVRHKLGQFIVSSAGFSPDASRLAASDNTEVVRVWDTNTGALVAGPIKGSTRAFSFSPDSRQLAMILLDSTAIVWDLEKNHRQGEPMPLTAVSQVVRFSPDGNLIATASQDGITQLWDAKTTKSAGRLLRHRSNMRGAEFSSDSRRLLTWTPAEARVWDVATGVPLTDPLIGGNDNFSATFSADETRIATWARATSEVRIWSSTSGQLLAEPVTVVDANTTGKLAFSSSDRFLSMTLPGGVAVWSVPPRSGRDAVPDWLLRLATTFAGGEIDADAVFREQAFDAKAFDDLRRELAALPADAPYVEWGRWILADRATRSIAPGFTITPAEAAKLGGSARSGSREP